MSRRRSRFLLAIGAVAALALVAAACDDGAATDEILIGGIGPLSQPGSVQGGTDMKWAMELAVTDLNAQGGVLGQTVRLVFEDTMNTPDVAAAVAKTMVEENDVSAVVGEYHSAAALAAIPTYNEAELPVVFSETYNDKITGGDPEDPENLPANPPTIFRIAPTSTFSGGVVADWVTRGLGATKVVIVYEASDFGVGQFEATAAKLEPAGVEIASAQIELAQPDYTAVLGRLAEEHGDAQVVLFDGVTGETSYTAEQNAFDVGLIDDDSICYANQVAQDSEAFWAAVPDGAGCVFRFVGPVPSQYSALTTSVADRYALAFGKPPKAWVIEAYDSVLLVADAIERAGSTNSADVVAALETTTLTGTQGTYEWGGTSENPVPAGEPSFLWHQWPTPQISLVQYTATGQAIADAAVVWPEFAQTTPGSAYITPSG